MADRRPPAIPPSETLREIAARGAFLWERLAAGRYEHAPPPAADERIGERIRRWTATAGGGDPAALARRLAWDGLDLDTLRPWLGSVRLAPGAALPGWADTVAEIMATATGFDAATLTCSPCEAEAPLPFEEILLPVVACARRRLARRDTGAPGASAAGAYRGLAEDAARALERGLLNQLWPLFVEALHFEFLGQRHFGRSLLRAIGAPVAGSASRERYRAFVDATLADGLGGLFRQYPVLARHAATLVELWVAASAEFLDRLATDRQPIAARFGPAGGADPGRVISIDAGLSDRHHHGRSVCRVGFASGLQLVYKPKGAGLELAFNGLLEWYNARSGSLPLKTLAMLDRGDYAWVEALAQVPCASAAEAADFYERAGMLLCWMYALRANDCHNENLIACGAQPVLIDLETLLHHDPRAFDEAAATHEGEASALDRFWDSVLRTGMIPRWVVHAGLDMAYDVSGLATDATPTGGMGWRDVNTDDMSWGPIEPVALREKNVPMLDGRPLSPADHAEAIRRGFAATYRFILRHREELCAAGGPLAPFGAQRVRHVFRPTRIYGRIHEMSWTRESLRDGADYGIELDRLAFAFAGATERPDAWPVVCAELRAMERLDVPLFGGATDGDALTGDGMAPVAGYFRRASFAQALERLRAFGEADLDFQLAIIADSLHGLRARSELQPADAWPAGGAPPPTPRRLVEAAVAIGDELGRRALREADGGASWMGMAYMFRAGRFQLELLGDNLYEGRSGIALFLAALHRATGEPRHAALARSALAPLRRLIAGADAALRRHVVRSLGIGGAAGIGSVIYAWTRIAGLLGEAELIAEARRLAGWIGPDCIAADSQLDVIGGAAGAILGLVALHDACGDEAVLATARLCGEHLLRQRRTSAQGFEAWSSIAGAPPLAGFSHGAAGIACALARLHARTGEAAYLEAARGAIDYERSLFLPAVGNWPDLRGDDQGQDASPVQWCHGAPGIGLARLCCHQAAALPGVIDEAATAMATTQRHLLGRLDHLCCGNLGRADTLLEAARALGRDGLRQAALDAAGRVIERAARNGGYTLFSNLPVTVFHPGFFQGTAGIGYAFLRLAGHDLPAVLAWQ